MDLYYFNDFLRKERNKQKLSQEKFGEMLGITKQAISSIESYKNKVSHEIIERFCEKFGYRLYFQNFKKDLEKNNQTINA